MDQHPYQQPVPPYGGYQPQQPKPVITDRNVKLLLPFSALWLSPVKTIQRLKHERTLLWPLTLLALAGVPTMLSVMMNNADEESSLFVMFGLTFLFGPMFGIITGYLSMWIIGSIGRGTLDGVAKNEEIRNLLAWTSVPRLYTVPLYALLMAIFGIGILNDDSYMETWEMVLFWGIYGMIFLLEGWSFVIFSVGLAEIMEFSISIALFNYFAVIVQLLLWPRAVFLLIRFFTEGYY